MVQIAWMLGSALIVVFMFTIAHRLHGKLGLAPLFTMVGGFQHMQTNLTSAVYVETLPGVFLSPGSVVLFMSTVSIVLAIYIMEGAEEGRRMIYGVLFTNVAIAVLGALIVLQTRGIALGSPGIEYISMMVSSVRVFVAGTVAMAIDIVAVIVIYEYISEKLESITLRLTITLALIALLDSVLFGVAAFAGTKLWTVGLVYMAIAKMLAGIWYGVLFRLYVSVGRFVLPESQSAQDIFGMLTYRQRYKIARAKTERDGMTKLYNRGYFDRSINTYIAAKTPFTVVLIDIDDFKAVNDNYGHLAGDRAIMHLTSALLLTFRDDDTICRFGGDEFAVILPNIEANAVVPIADRLRDHISTQYDRSDPIYEFSTLGVSIGIGSFPSDGLDYERVVESADRRLYKSKKKGKNRTSSVGDDTLH